MYFYEAIKISCKGSSPDIPIDREEIGSDHSEGFLSCSSPAFECFPQRGPPGSIIGCLVKGVPKWSQVGGLLIVLLKMVHCFVCAVLILMCFDCLHFTNPCVLSPALEWRDINLVIIITIMFRMGTGLQDLRPSPACFWSALIEDAGAQAGTFSRQ